MYDINTLKGLNEAAFLRRFKGVKNPETETTRNCSYHESSRGLILHSAKKRSTLFVGSAKAIKAFKLKFFSTNSQDRRNEIIESYFARA